MPPTSNPKILYKQRISRNHHTAHNTTYYFMHLYKNLGKILLWGALANSFSRPHIPYCRDNSKAMRKFKKLSIFGDSPKSQDQPTRMSDIKKEMSPLVLVCFLEIWLNKKAPQCSFCSFSQTYHWNVLGIFRAMPGTI